MSLRETLGIDLPISQAPMGRHVFASVGRSSRERRFIGIDRCRRDGCGRPPAQLCRPFNNLAYRALET
jgi:hypothetical protein